MQRFRWDLGEGSRSGLFQVQEESHWFLYWLGNCKQVELWGWRRGSLSGHDARADSWSHCW